MVKFITVDAAELQKFADSKQRSNNALIETRDKINAFKQYSIKKFGTEPSFIIKL